MTTTVLRPNSTVVSGGSLVGNASRHGATSDDSDASYVTLTTGQSFRLGLTTKSLAAGEITKSASVGVRLSQSGSVIAKLIRPSPFSVPISKIFARSEASPATSTTQPLSIGYSQGDIDALQVEVEGLTSNPRILRTLELYVNLVTVAKPVTAVDAVTPDPYTASTSVPIAWTNTLDADGGEQTHYEWKVFTDAQYGAGGFDPDTSTPTATSGEVVSASTSATLAPVVSGDTYRAYVRVAQTVNGAEHRSAWAFDQFDLDVDTSDVDTVTAAANNAAGKIAVTVARVDASEAWELIEVERSIDAGVTFAPVRYATLVDATGSADSFAVDDYEVPGGQAVIYRARATYYSAGLPITGAWTESSSTSWTTVNRAEWLKDPQNPSLNLTIESVGFDQQQRSSRAGVFFPLGSDEAIVVSDVLTAPSGALTVRVTGRTEALALDAILENAGTLLLNLLPQSLVGPRRDGFQYIGGLSTSESWETQYYIGIGTEDAEDRLVTIQFVRSTVPADPTVGSL